MKVPGSPLADMVSGAEPEAWARAFAEEPELLIYKHPPACWAGVRAARELTALLQEDPALPLWWVDVVGERALSNQLAAMFGVRHESPQALLLRRGELVWSGSHGSVSQERIARARREVNREGVDR